MFIASTTVGVLTTIAAYGGTAKGGTVATDTLLTGLDHVASIGFNGNRPQANAGQSRQGSPAAADPAQGDAPTATNTAIPTALVNELTSISGVQGATIVYSEPGAGQLSSDGFVLCSQLAHTPAI